MAGAESGVRTTAAKRGAAKTTRGTVPLHDTRTNRFIYGANLVQSEFCFRAIGRSIEEWLLKVSECGEESESRLAEKIIIIVRRDDIIGMLPLVLSNDPN